LKNKKYIWLPIILLLLPSLIRFLWFNRGFNFPGKTVVTPDYPAIVYSVPALSTPSINPLKFEKQPVILLDMSHGNYFSLSELGAFTDELTKTGGRLEIVDYNNDLPTMLKYATGYIIIAPTSAFYQSELTAIHHFVERGGRLLVISDPTRDVVSYGSSYSSGTILGSLTGVDYANQILTPYQIAFNNDYAYNLVENEGNFRNVISSPSVSADFKDTIKWVILYSSHSLRTNQNTILLGVDKTYSSLTDSGEKLALAVTNNANNVLAIGDFTFMTVPYLQVADNQLMFYYLIQFISGGEIQHDLSDFPYLFGKNVTILHSADMDLDNTMLSNLAYLQSYYKDYGTNIQLGDADPDNTDLIILGLTPPSQEILPYLENFKIDFTGNSSPIPEPIFTPTPEPVNTPLENATELPPTESNIMDLYSFGIPNPSETLQVPGFGEIPSTGMGYILYDRGKLRNVLILLADTIDNLNSLVSKISLGDLTNCIIREKVAICPFENGEDGGYGR
jgi:hypothetical protein